MLKLLALCGRTGNVERGRVGGLRPAVRGCAGVHAAVLGCEVVDQQSVAVIAHFGRGDVLRALDITPVLLPSEGDGRVPRANDASHAGARSLLQLLLKVERQYFRRHCNIPVAQALVRKPHGSHAHTRSLTRVLTRILTKQLSETRRKRSQTYSVTHRLTLAGKVSQPLGRPAHRHFLQKIRTIILDKHTQTSSTGTRGRRT